MCGCRNKCRGAMWGPQGRGCALDPPGQVVAPPDMFSVPDILKYYIKIIFHFQDCRRPGNGGSQTCLPAAHGVALRAGPYGPSSPTSFQDPREGPSLARRTTQDLLGGSLTRPAREGRRDQGKGNLARFL